MDTNPSAEEPAGFSAGPGAGPTAPPAGSTGPAPGPAGGYAPYGPYPATGPTRPPGENSFFAGIRRTGLFRGDDRWIAGVSDGVARRFGLDPLLVRGLFAVTVLLGGLGLIVYGVAWALLPEQRDGRIHLEEMIAGRFDVALLGALAFVLVGFGRGDHWFWFWNGPPGWVQAMLWLAFVVGGIALVVVALNRRQPVPPRAAGYPPYGAAASAPAPATGAPARPTYPPSAYPASAYPTAPVTAPAGPAAPSASTTAPTHHRDRRQQTTTYPTGTPVGGYGPTAPVGGYGPTAPLGGYGPTAPAGPGNPPPPYGPATAVRPTPPPAPVKAPKPPKPPRSGPGVAMVGIVVALSLLSLAVLLLAERSGDFDGPVLLTALGVAIVLAGLGIIVSGLRGRTSGTLGFLAIVAILVAGPVGASSGVGEWWWTDGAHRTFSAAAVQVPDRVTAARGYNLGFGDVTVDLTQVTLTNETLDVPVSLGAGDLTIVVPDDAGVVADVRLGAGSVTWDVDGEQTKNDGVGMGTLTYSNDQADTGTPQLHLHVGVGAGDVRITEENR
ncbi:PspC domain-containing protein [Cellulomonas sp.]|uniref:PspC domain-containing protein n=1 Tax=Cellulomonas sp. TaxID=40001 RepID=UPI001B01A07E|nr:PspC domain-containing protein [Cellulomonas sp.]MBO9554250.1 PspC domain-containing protein [Cellulomonas sp.]